MIQNNMSIGRLAMYETTSLSKILNRLLFEKNIKPAELARLTKVSQPTIHRLITGTSNRPHLSSLKPIADFFSISTEQLIGLSPIPWIKTKDEENIKTLPILNWSQVEDWSMKRIGQNQESEFENIIVDTNIGNNSFGLIIKDESMEPVFSVGSLIIIDPEKEIRDRGFILVQFKNSQEPILRQLIIDDKDYYVKAISPALYDKIHKIGKDDKIFGVLVQSRRNFDN